MKNGKNFTACKPPAPVINYTSCCIAPVTVIHYDYYCDATVYTTMQSARGRGRALLATPPARIALKSNRLFKIKWIIKNQIDYLK